MPTPLFTSDLESYAATSQLTGWQNNFGGGHSVITNAGSAVSGTRTYGNSSDSDGSLYTAAGVMGAQAVRVDLRVPTMASASFVTEGLFLRSALDGAGWFRIYLQTNGTNLALTIGQYFNGNPATSGFVIPAVAPADVLCVEARVIGNVYEGRVWLRGTARPTAATVSYTDASNALTTGYPGLRRVGAFTSFGVDNIVVTAADGSEGFFDPVPDTTVPVMTGTMTSSAITASSFTIDWSATTRSDNVAVTGYETSPDNATWTDQGNVTSRNFTGKTASTGYTTYVRAYDAAGNKSTPALSLLVTTSAAPDTTLPTMNGSLTSASVTSGGYTLNWPAASDNVAVAGYEGSTDNGTTWANWGLVLTKAITGASASTTYNTKVRAYDAAANKATPLSLAVTTSASADTTVPTLAGSITLSLITNTTARLAWPAGADNVAVTGYEYSIDGGTSYLDAGNVLLRDLTGLTIGTAYPIRVRCYDSAGNRSTPALSATLTTTGIVTFTPVAVLKAAADGAPAASVAIHALIHDLTTGALMGTKTGLTTSAGGLPPPFTGTFGVAGTAYDVKFVSDASNLRRSLEVITPV